MDRAADVFKLALMPEMETFDGFCGVSLLINREAGLAVTSVALDSRATMEGNREQARGLRARGSAEARLEITEVAEFELALATSTGPSWSDPAATATARRRGQGMVIADDTASVLMGVPASTAAVDPTARRTPGCRS